MARKDTTTVRKIGDSLGVIIPLPILRAHGIERGDELQILNHDKGALVLLKIRTIT